jgi:hypothetical protein
VCIYIYIAAISPFKDDEKGIMTIIRKLDYMHFIYIEYAIVR